MENVFDLFKERGLIAQATDETAIRELLGKEKITFYTGFDPTADSLHVGHFMQLIIMRYMQQAGHRPVILLGGGTTMAKPTPRASSPMVATALSRGQLADTAHPRYLERIASVGVAQTPVQLRVADAQGCELPLGEVGEVLVRGDTVMAGYWRDAEATTRALGNAWVMVSRPK